MVKPDPDDEFDSRPRPIVVIPNQPVVVFLCAAAGIAPVLALVVAPMVGHWLWPDRIHVMWGPGPVGWLEASWPLIPLVCLVPLAIWIGRVPAFAVLEEGIKLNIRRLPPGRSVWDFMSHGLYCWSEVSHCRWSPYRPGVLSIHLGAAEDRIPVVIEPVADHLKVPPMIYFYRVPERYRAAVEAAIRACGKWAE
jgi:hypothetical protein